MCSSDLAGGPLDAVFPPTLTISSGKPGRQRMLYSVPAAKLQQIPDRATIKIGVPSFEILFRSRQGALMGAHPDTEGYFTTAHGGFEFAKNPPEMPQWLYDAIANAFPTQKYKRRPTSGVVTQQINIHYEEGSKFQLEEAVSEALIYLEHLDLERAIDYEEWLAIGMALHQVDDSLLEAWVEWSSQVENFESGVCEQKWSSFERLPGGPSPEGARGLQTLRAKAKEDGFLELGGYVVESPEVLALKARELFGDDDDPSMLHEAMRRMTDGLSDEEKEEAEREASKKGKPRTPPSSELAEVVGSLVDLCGWRYDPKYETYYSYSESRGIWKRQEHNQEFKHFVQEIGRAHV